MAGKAPRRTQIGEAVPAYGTARAPLGATRKRQGPERAVVTLSSKHQITLPVAMVRRLALEPGDKLVARLEDGAIVLQPRPRDWVDYIGGSLPNYYGKTKEEIDAYLAEVRQGWGEVLEPLEDSRSSKQ